MADLGDPIAVVGERQTEGVVAVDEVRDLVGQLFVGAGHGQNHTLAEAGPGSIVRGETIDLWVDRQTGFEEKSVDM